MFITKILIAGGALYIAAKTITRRRPKKTFAWLNEPVPQVASISGVNEAITGVLSTDLTHELRTPLHVILGYARMLQGQSGLSADVRDGLGTIETNGRQLLAVINHVLSALRGEPKPLEFQPYESISANDDVEPIDFSQVRLPEGLYAQLMDAAEQGHLTSLKALADDMWQLGDEEEKLATRLLKLIRKFDIMKIRRCLAEAEYEPSTD